ncbi:hypothetical protein AB0346_09970 [Nocardia beijingensis]|uniref:hypothetical protein n=1 Tax=Nocardia beijingensis TaxID=95162 RepID=UPI00344F694B
MTDASTHGSVGSDRFAQYGLIPTDLQQAPIEHDFSADAARDDLHTKHLRGLQNLAVEASREHNPPGQTPTAAPWLAATPRSAALETALRAATRDATADGVPAEKIERAVDLGRTGVYWHQQPSDRTLGRLEQMNAALAAAEMDAAALRALVDQVPQFVLQAWSQKVAHDLSPTQSASATAAHPSLASSITTDPTVEHSAANTPSTIGSAITDTMPDRSGTPTWTNETSPTPASTERGISSPGAEL